MDQVLISGRMEGNMLEDINLIKKADMGNIIGTMVEFFKEIG